ncbi:MAG: glycosyltransferase [Janthinobacterium lividum]
MAKILIHTLGSSGDLNPFLALALELQQRGHHIQFALSPKFTEKARTLGFSAVVAGEDPDWDSDMMRRMLAMHRVEPIQIMFQEALIPAIVPATEALEPLVQEADLFISHTIQLAAPAVAQRTGTPWISASPATLIHETAAYPPPSVAWKGCPAWLARLGWQIGYRMFEGLDALAAVEYKKLGVAPRPNVISGGTYSRLLTLGLWSPSFFPRPSDWPSWFKVGGYARWDGPHASNSGGVRFEKKPSPTVLFTLGSSVVNHPGEFWRTALAALASTDWNAVFLGAPAGFPIPSALSGRVQIIPYAPYADLFPLMDAIVHQGGVGTTQAACYYGIPSIIVPRGFDQFENAAHLQREGWGLRLMPESCTPHGLRIRLERLLQSPKIKARTQALGSQMQAEPGVTRSADLVEEVLASQRKP